MVSVYLVEVHSSQLSTFNVLHVLEAAEMGM